MTDIDTSLESVANTSAKNFLRKNRQYYQQYFCQHQSYINYQITTECNEKFDYFIYSKISMTIYAYILMKVNYNLM